MVLAALLLWVNCIPRHPYYSNKVCYGWPLICYFPKAIHMTFSGDNYPVVYGPGFAGFSTTFNVVLAIIIHITFVGTMERLIRRRERKQQEPRGRKERKRRVTNKPEASSPDIPASESPDAIGREAQEPRSLPERPMNPGDPKRIEPRA